MNIIWELEHETFFNRTTYSYFTFVLTGRWQLMVSSILHLLFFSISFSADFFPVVRSIRAGKHNTF